MKKHEFIWILKNWNNMCIYLDIEKLKKHAFILILKIGEKKHAFIWKLKNWREKNVHLLWYWKIGGKNMHIFWYLKIEKQFINTFTHHSKYNVAMETKLYDYKLCNIYASNLQLAGYLFHYIKRTMTRLLYVVI